MTLPAPHPLGAHTPPGHTHRGHVTAARTAARATHTAVARTRDTAAARITAARAPRRGPTPAHLAWALYSSGSSAPGPARAQDPVQTTGPWEGHGGFRSGSRAVPGRRARAAGPCLGLWPPRAGWTPPRPRSRRAAAVTAQEEPPAAQSGQLSGPQPTRVFSPGAGTGQPLPQGRARAPDALTRPRRRAACARRGSPVSWTGRRAPGGRRLAHGHLTRCLIGHHEVPSRVPGRSGPGAHLVLSVSARRASAVRQAPRRVRAAGGRGHQGAGSPGRSLRNPATSARTPSVGPPGLGSRAGA